jgi:hypothetical protein
MYTTIIISAMPFPTSWAAFLIFSLRFIFMFSPEFCAYLGQRLNWEIGDHLPLVRSFSVAIIPVASGQGKHWVGCPLRTWWVRVRI